VAIPEEERQRRHLRYLLDRAGLREDEAHLLPETICSLSTRAMSALLGAGIPGSARREDILPLVESGALSPLGRDSPPNYGVVSHREVLRWLGLPEGAWIQDARNPKVEKRYVDYLEKRGYRITPP